MVAGGRVAGPGRRRFPATVGDAVFTQVGQVRAEGVSFPGVGADQGTTVGTGARHTGPGAGAGPGTPHRTGGIVG